jgi:hypothetical protein
MHALTLSHIIRRKTQIRRPLRGWGCVAEEFAPPMMTISCSSVLHQLPPRFLKLLVHAAGLKTVKQLLGIG